MNLKFRSNATSATTDLTGIRNLFLSTDFKVDPRFDAYSNEPSPYVMDNRQPEYGFYRIRESRDCNLHQLLYHVVG
jgi:hypothetical protein